MGMRDAWDIPEFRRLLVGNGINMMGSSIFIIGMSWTVAQIGGPKMFGLIWTAYFLGHLPLLLYGGMVVDRMPRRTVALIADLSQAVLVTLGIIALLAGFDEIKTLLVVTFLTGGATAFSIPAIGALVPDLVEEELLPQANAMRGVAMTAAWMLGPLIGGFTVGLWGIEVCLLIDVVTFIFSGAVLWTISEIPVVRDEEAGDLREEVVEAWAFVKTQPWLFAGILMFMIWHIGDSAIEIGVPFIIENKGLGANEYGLFGAVGALGAMAGSILGGIRPIPKEVRGKVFYIFIGGIAWCMLMWAMPIPFWAILVFVLLEGVLGGTLGVIWRTAMSDSVDQHLRGRVNSLDAIGSLIFIPFAPILGGAMIEATNVLTTYSIAVAFMVLTTTAGLIVPSFRRFERVDSERFPITAGQNPSD
uniref:Major facilitator superfamily protein n=1 Tax=uncultured marine group II/III euryarchaeote KM3_135_H05 TaxID=1457866 RepID=A0A075GA73_9EURY|nr:major facilitator superfamily protein [uncultured marine group II/III euryarchaeote KM3_135_H05]|tara:strand:+ start:11717 stop:12967 length:1251 start_codon:yes stop_codon:yes gene_type:complete